MQMQAKIGILWDGEVKNVSGYFTFYLFMNINGSVGNLAVTA